MAGERELIHEDQHSTNDDDTTIRTGTLWTIVAHTITAVIGSGVLSLAWSTAQLDLLIPLLELGTDLLLASAVRVILGEKKAWVCGLLQYMSFHGTSIAYVVTTATCINVIRKSNCYHNIGRDAKCEYNGNIYMLLFGVVQIVMSQIPNFNSMVLVSVVAAIMSFCYASIGFGLGFAQVIENGNIAGSITGVPASSVSKKLWHTFQALGDIALSYPYAFVLLEIQDSIKSPPENKVTKQASAIAVTVTSIFYLGCGCFGYAAFGNNAPGNLLTGFGFYEPYWIVGFANVCIIIHLIGGYQSLTQLLSVQPKSYSASQCLHLLKDP
uniref:Probable amino acid permease 7 isoform X2 n=1 Tax=Tanacetum cinerariifolium TaxID=118510 RepID=A0A699HH32_TANCI|nr:probable amino acid permease 7 isoform X2 [Tanacetum cinerariifolium]